MTTPEEKIINDFKLFWQYPVITEKTFFEQNKYDTEFLGFPWATILDKRYNFNTVYKIITKNLNLGNKKYTCCQHISFRRLIPLFKTLGIKILYTPHKINNEDNLDGIQIKPCPLYAVNVEDQKRNVFLKDLDLVNKQRNILYSFMGAYQENCYLTDIRKNIFKLPKNKHNVIINTGEWYFNHIVYSQKQNYNTEINKKQGDEERKSKYNNLLVNSKFTLCPSGSGPNSIRFWEALACGSIPVLLADTLELPEHELWETSIVKVKESDIFKINSILSKISETEIKARRDNCIKIYNFFKHDFRGCKNLNKTDTALLQNQIIHYCCGSYDQGLYGGVERYDYQIKLAFPNRIFFQGPQQKNKMLHFLEKCDKPIVITDNHLSMDIPNKYPLILVHHGSALTHAEREPTWNKYWKNLCCNGQIKMLKYRKPNNTYIISISEFCTYEFTKYFPKIYPLFKNIKILHSTELNEDMYKKRFNNKPIILGNWPCINKGKKSISILSNKLQNIRFKQLNVKIKNGDIDRFNKEKQTIYCTSDMFLQLSLCEGNSYSALDALLCGLVVISSNVGLFYKDIPEDCFVKLDWQKLNEVEYLIKKINYAWENKEQLSRNAREWYMHNCRFCDWKIKMNKLAKDFYNEQYCL